MTSEFLPHLVYKYFESHRDHIMPNLTSYANLSYIDSLMKPLDTNNESSMKGYVRYSLSGKHPLTFIVINTSDFCQEFKNK